MKGRILWFVVGFVVAASLALLFAALRGRPRDYTIDFPAWQREDPVYTPLKAARSTSLGPLALLVPQAGNHELVGEVLLKSGDRYEPVLVVRDLDRDGVADSLMLADASDKSISVDDRDQDHSWDQVLYSNGTSSNSVTLVDEDVDGVFDLKLGPGALKTRLTE